MRGKLLFRRILNLFMAVVLLSTSTAKGDSDCNSLFDWEAPSFIQKISRYRIPDIAKAENILSSWKELPLKESKEYFGTNSNQIAFVRVKSELRPMGVLGKIELIELSSDYTIFVVKDRDGRIHAIDSTQEDISIHVPRPIPEEVSFIERFTEKSFFHTDLARLREYVENNRVKIESDPETQRIKAILESSIQEEKFSRIKKIYERIVKVAARSTFPALFFWGGSSIARVLGLGADSYFLQHGSNFYLGLVGMGLMHGILSSTWPTKRFSFLVAAALTNIGANIHEEVDLGAGRIANGMFVRGTDWADISAGMLSVGVYFSVVAIAEAINRKKSKELYDLPSPRKPR